MKEWLNWLFECDYNFVRVENEDSNVHEYDFGYGIRVVKREKGRGSRGGMVEVNGYTTWHGSAKELIARVIEVVEQEREKLAQNEPVVEPTTEEEIQTMTEEELDTLAIQIAIKIIYDQMQLTLDNTKWKALHNEYVRLNNKLNAMERG